jgi:hypothetical protein|tara:strand:- start:317 stop:868 length:552 start_codon:yes stop_codon:yes gene_type:complete
MTTLPKDPENLCAIFKEKPSWYRSIKRSEKRWNIQAPMIMSVLYRESSYRKKAKPPRTKLLGMVPWRRPSSAYGFAQATNETWFDYRKATGRRFADRDDFGDAVDFVGWYLDRSSRTLGINRNDAKQLYLSYHEGLSGYRAGSWRKKTWLLGAAAKVQNKKVLYSQQLTTCRQSLNRKRWLFF